MSFKNVPATPRRMLCNNTWLVLGCVCKYTPHVYNQTCTSILSAHGFRCSQDQFSLFSHLVLAQYVSSRIVWEGRGLHLIGYGAWNADARLRMGKAGILLVKSVATSIPCFLSLSMPHHPRGLNLGFGRALGHVVAAGWQHNCTSFKNSVS